jgi:predicted house-cleaning NTP pyrophosphatase (Maf/HAM1 superfamily)
MKSKKQKREEILKKFEVEFEQLKSDHEKRVKEHHEAGYGWYLVMPNRYFYVEEQINSLKKNLGLK